MEVRRQAFLPKVLSVSDAAVVIRRPFKSPCPRTPSGTNAELLRRLSARKRFVPWGSARQPFTPIQNVPLPILAPAEEEPVSKEELPPGIEPLVLWQPDETAESGSDNAQPIIVDTHLVKFLRQHQR